MFSKLFSGLRWSFAALLAIVTIGCAPAHRPDSQQLTGVWKSDPYVGQLGKSVDTLCFHADGTAANLVETQAGRISGEGTYSLSGEKLMLAFKGAAYGRVTVDARLRDDTLTLVQDGKAQRYRRVNSRCPVP